MSSILCRPETAVSDDYVCSFDTFGSVEEARDAAPEILERCGEKQQLFDLEESRVRPKRVVNHAAKTMTIFRSENSVHKNIPLVEILLSLAVYGPLTRSRLLKHFSRKSEKAVNEFDRATAWLIAKGAVSVYHVHGGRKPDLLYSLTKWQRKITEETNETAGDH